MGHTDRYGEKGLVMKLALTIGAALLGLCLAPVPALGAAFSQLIVYGDSWSDLGRASAASGGLIPPYNEGGGRFSNGPVWVEYLATRLGLTVAPNTNFAVGGAGTGTFNLGQSFVPGSTELIGVATQVANNPVSDPDALYILWAGANDYGFAGITDPATPVANLTAHLTTLISRGAQTILVPNLPNLGNFPLALGTPLEAPANLLTQGHNLGLSASVSLLQSNFPGVKIEFLDVNSFIGDITVNPGAFGFANVSEGCWLVSCAAPETYFYWDDVHFTTRGHQLIGDFAYQAVVPEPLTILGSLTAVGFGAAYKRRRNRGTLMAKGGRRA